MILPLIPACQRHEPGPQERIELSDRPPLLGDVPLDSPDTSKAGWTVDQRGQSIDFGNPDARPMLTLDCRLNTHPPQLAIIRHVPSRPGQSALFPVIGNGMKVRFKVEATLRDGEWRWEGTLPADDPEFDVFTGPRDLKATLPGGGTLEIAGSRIPGEFVTWCRAGGDVLRAEAGEQDKDGANKPVSGTSPAR